MASGFKEKLIEQWARAQGQTPALAFFAGLGADILTLGRIDEPRNILVQVVYLTLAAITLTASLAEKSSWVNTGSGVKRLVARGLVRYGRLVFHFATGALLSAFTFFYFKSSSGLASLVFLLVLGAGLVLNELPALKRLGAAFRTTLFQLSLVSFLTYILPMAVGELHVGLFVLAAGLSILVAWSLAGLLRWLKVDAERLRQAFIRPALVVTGTFVVLYFLQWIPPIPLSVQELVVAHKVERVGESYRLEVDPDPPGGLFETEVSITKSPGERVYVFARVFAPRHFKDEVYLRWERKDEVEGWVKTDRIRLPIRGGREAGFRGYTYKQNHQAGAWRVFVETDDGREIGRLDFRLREPSEEAEMLPREQLFH